MKENLREYLKKIHSSRKSDEHIPFSTDMKNVVCSGEEFPLSEDICGMHRYIHQIGSRLVAHDRSSQLLCIAFFYLQFFFLFLGSCTKFIVLSLGQE